MAYYGKLANILPLVNTNIKIFGIKTDAVNGLTSIPLQIIYVLYGNAIPLSQDTIIVGDTNPVGLVCVVLDRSVSPNVTATVLVYFNAVSVPTLPDNFSRLVQKIPKGVFEEVAPLTPGNVGNPQGWDFKARSQLIDDYYNNSYLPLYDELYSRILTSDLIYQYTSNTNFTSNVTTLPTPAFNSVYPNQLALLMASVVSVGLNQYDLSLFVSRYIYYRTGIPALVLLDIAINNFQYMRLSPESDGNTEAASWSVLAPEDFLTQQRTDPIVINNIQDTPDGYPDYGWNDYAPTIPPAPPNPPPYLIGSAYLAPEGYQPVLNNLRWYIDNSNNINLTNMTNELQALINNISRGDIGNLLYIRDFDFNLTDKNYTYKFDPRFVNPIGVLRAIRYTSDEDFPENVHLYEIEAITWQLTH